MNPQEMRGRGAERVAGNDALNSPATPRAGRDRTLVLSSRNSLVNPRGELDLADNRVVGRDELEIIDGGPSLLERDSDNDICLPLQAIGGSHACFTSRLLQSCTRAE